MQKPRYDKICAFPSASYIKVHRLHRHTSPEIFVDLTENLSNERPTTFAKMEFHAAMPPSMRCNKKSWM